MVSKTQYLEEHEQENPEWWAKHWKDSSIYFVMRLHSLFFDPDTDAEMTLNVLRAVVPAYVESLGLQNSLGGIPTKEDWPTISVSLEGDDGR